MRWIPTHLVILTPKIIWPKIFLKIRIQVASKISKIVRPVHLMKISLFKISYGFAILHLNFLIEIWPLCNDILLFTNFQFSANTVVVQISVSFSKIISKLGRDHEAGK